MKLLLTSLLLALPWSAAGAAREPIIDIHLHALGAADEIAPPSGMCTPFVLPAWDQRIPYRDFFARQFSAPNCRDPVPGPANDEALMRETIAILDRLNVIGVLSGTPDRVAAWRRASPARLIPALSFELQPEYTVQRLRELHQAGRLDVLGEVTTQYIGVSPDDPRLEPYWALAEELDIPVGIHVGPGPPGAVYLGYDRYRARMHSALTMEEVLVRHPRMRVYLMHAGYPMIDDLLALLYAHPQVYVDVGVIVFIAPRPAFYRYLQAIFDAGFGNRVMFGSDQMTWPGAIERSIRTIEDAPFLTRAQKRDILYNNAARFLRLSPQQIAAHRMLGRSH
jgi:predicted TIM-barrel fold metal-dependent hydrolase